MINNPSDEQITIINQVTKNNIIVDAVAGSGKTTTILHIALKYPNLDILVLTYNAKLRLETLNRINELNLRNIEVQTYHGFCVKYYDSNCRTDNQINNVIQKEVTTRKKLSFDLLIIDEAQDMTALYYELVCKIIKNNNGVRNICILGDKNQGIFNFNNADTRFITLADKLFDLNALPWSNCELKTSYRLTQQMSSFMNECILHENRIIAQKQGPKVRYIICDTFRNENTRYNSYKEVKRYLAEGYTYDDFFILAPSVKSLKAPVRKLANKLTEKKIPIYVPNNDDERIDQDVIGGKIVFSTFHQVKGLERKVVLVFGVSHNYFTFYDKLGDPNKCPNTIYVALTRAKECLTLVHHYQDDYCNFINPEKLRLHTVILQDPVFKLKKHIVKKREQQECGVTELLKHLPFEVIQRAKKHLKITEFQKQGKKINIDTKIKQGKYYENVAEITGTAIPAHFEYINKGTMEIQTALQKEFVKQKLERKIDTPTNPQELLKLSNEYCAFRSGYNYKLSQIIDYNWLNDDQLKLSIDRLGNHISKNASFEKKFQYSHPTLIRNNKIFTGVTDCIDGNALWDFKCVNKLEDEHILQLGIYAFLLHEDNAKKKLELIESMQKYNIATYDFVEHNNVTFASDDKLLCGNVTKVFKNGNITIKVNDKIHRVTRSSIFKVNYIDKIIEKISELNEKKYEFYLFNILDNQILKIDAEYESLKTMVDYLISNKFEAHVAIDNEKFTKQTIMIKNKYFNQNLSSSTNNESKLIEFTEENYDYLMDLNEEDNEKAYKNFRFDDDIDEDAIL